MANYRPKSLSELNNVYDKAMRAEKAIKEGSGLLSATENETTPQSENIFLQLETKAAEADKNQVFDPDITNIANDFLKRFAQQDKPKVTPKEIKRPAPTIQSVYHTPAKPKQEESSDVSLNLGNDFSSKVEAPAAPLHKPAPTMPTIQTPLQQESAPEAEIKETVPIKEELESTPVEEPKIVVAPPVVTKAEIPSPAKTNYTPPKKVPSRVRITSSERSELMEEYLRVMSDEDEEPKYRKPKFSFFKKKKKYDEDYDDADNLYEELPEEADSAEDEVPVVPFDGSDVKFTDEYSNSAEEMPESNMSISDYIKEDFDYDDDEDDTLDVSTSFSKSDEDEIISEENTVESEVNEDLTDDIAENPAEKESEETTEEVAEEKSDDVESVEAIEEIQETAEDVVYPTEEAIDEAPQDSPAADMVFEDIFSVSDESKRSHTGGNWEEVFGEEFSPEKANDTEPEVIIPEVIIPEEEETIEVPQEEYQQDETAEYPEYAEEEEEAYPDTEPTRKKSGGTLKLLTVLICILSIISSAAVLVIGSVLDVNSGNLISDKYRAYSVSGNITDLGLVKGDLIITENSYAHTDDLYVYQESTENYNFGKVISGSINITGDYIYVTQTVDGTSRINRDKSMGVVVATYSGIGGVLAVICEYYIFIAATLLVIAVGAIALLVIVSKRKADSDESLVIPFEPHRNDTDKESSEEEEEAAEDDYYDYDTDGIEQGLFSDI